MSLTDTLAFFACLIAGLWVFGQFHRIGIRGGPGLVATLVVLWFSVSSLMTLYGTLSQAWALLLNSADGLLSIVLVVLVALGLRLWWAHRRARQLFDV
jgi:hypothetical protein